MPRKLAPLPTPSASLHAIDLPLHKTDRALIRIHRLEHDPAFWGRTGNNRFDAPNGEYGVLYAAETFDGAFIETFGDVSPKTLSVNSLAARGVASVSPQRELRLVDLAGAGLSQLGLDGRICTNSHDLSQDWSHALWAHPSQPDGIWYAARHDANERSVAIFSRAETIVSVARQNGLMDSSHRTLTAPSIDKYGFALLP